MAETTVREIEIRAKYESLAEMRRAIEMAKDTLDSLTEGTAEYEAALIDVKAAQDQYNKNLRVAVKENTAAKGSYNDLVNQLARLKEEWKNADPKSATFKNLTEQINTVKDQLGDMDHKIGNWQRNVGNYAQSIGGMLGQALGRIPGLAAAAGQGFQAFGGAINAAFSSNPVGVILMIATAITSLVPKIIEANKKLGEFKDEIKQIKDEARGLDSSLNAVDFEIRKMEARGESLEKIYEKRRAAAVEDEKKALAAYGDFLVKSGTNLKKYSADEKEEYKKLLKAKEDTTAAVRKIDEDYVVDRIKRAAENNKKFAEQEKQAAEQRKKDAETRAKWERDEAAAIAAADAEFEAEWDKEQAAREAAEDKKRKEKTAKELSAIEERKQAILDAQAAEVASWQRYQANIQAVAAATASILNEVAGAWQNQIQAQIAAGDISEAEGRRQFENVKALQYAVTWINTLSAVVSALAEPELPWVVKAANAAAALTTGIANSVKISNTELGSTQVSSATGAGVESAPRVSLTPQALEQYSRTTGATGEEVLNAQTKAGDVILVTSQLEAKQHRDGSIVREASF